MTPKQRKKLAAILLKEGEEGWTVEYKHIHSPLWIKPGPDYKVDCALYRYRAIRTERIATRTPLPIEHYKRGMEVLIDCSTNAWLVLRSANNGTHLRLLLGDVDTCHVQVSEVTHWRLPNETEWHQARTETSDEREVERLELDKE